MLDRTNSMFTYHNLPSTLPAYIVELYLQLYGYICITSVNSTDFKSTSYIPSSPTGLYGFYGGLGGEYDIYNRPTQFIVASHRLKNSINKSIIYTTDSVNSTDLDPCVVVKNDTNYMGLLPLYERYASQLTENDISIRSAQINSRAQIGISTSTDRDAEAARKYLDNLEAGKLAQISTSAFLEGVSISNISTTSANLIIQLIELQQYLKASWYNELGLNANFNMKREYLSRDEIATTTDVLLPLVDDMLKSREEGISLVNSIFGTNIIVEKSSAWANKQQEVLSSIYSAANEASIPVQDDISETMEEGSDSNDTISTDSTGVNGGVSTGESTTAAPITDPATDPESVESNSTETSEISQEETVQPVVQVNIEINNAGEENDVSTESETQEKSEESDTE